MKKTRILSIFFGIFLLSNLFYFDAFGEDYQGLGAGNGIGMVYSPHIDLNFLRLTLIVDRETNLIAIDFSPYFFNGTKSGNVAFILPYDGILGENSGWTMKKSDLSTVLIKQYQCSENDPCTALSREFLNFIVDGKLDTKTSSHHTVCFELYNHAPYRDQYDYVLSLKEHKEHYNLGFRDLSDGTVILIVENTAINLVSNPQAVLDRFYNSATEYENLQFVWDISKTNFVQAEYDVNTKPDVLPKEVEVLKEVESVSLLPIIQEQVGLVWEQAIEPIVIGVIAGVIAGIVVLLVNKRYLRLNPTSNG